MSVNNLIRLGKLGSATLGRRYLTTSPPLRTAGVRHTTDSYAKDVDHTPAQDTQVHRLDPLSENFQKPCEAPSGEFSRTGVKAAYANVDQSDQPYAPKGEGEQQRYGGTKSWVADKGPETSHPGEGPTGSDAGGRKS
jgi:hypothetical protein